MPSTFLSLVDAPNTYSGQANKVIAVTTSEKGLEFVDQNSIVVDGATTFEELIDVESYPTSEDPPYIFYLNGGTSNVKYSRYYAGESFLDLTDTPSDYTGQDGKYVQIGVGCNTIFDDGPYQQFKFQGLSDTPSTIVDEQFLQVREAAGLPNGGEIVYYSASEATFTFAGLEDTPNDYTGQDNKFVYVFDNRLKYHSGDFTSFFALLDTPDSSDGAVLNDLVVVREDEKGLTFQQSQNTLSGLSYLAHTMAGVSSDGGPNAPRVDTTCPDEGLPADRFGAPAGGISSVFNQVDFQMVGSNTAYYEYIGSLTKNFYIEWNASFEARDTGGYIWKFALTKNDPSFPVPSLPATRITNVGWIGGEGNQVFYEASGGQVLRLEQGDRISLTLTLIAEEGGFPPCRIGSYNLYGYSMVAQEIY